MICKPKYSSKKVFDWLNGAGLSNEMSASKAIREFPSASVAKSAETAVILR